ncbi:MAG: CoB--CoM heterodisulfide reductase iron-sulfur subunit B family protein [Omnitrophica bacterium]|nr:CoB--CoM heterodisulfide reductase iron-sulfur subunit B family protein [Candidatus Omnitrophota bacterium]
MKKIPYFPGCTLTNKAKGLNETAKLCTKILDIELVELDNWYCCQANFSTVTDNLMNHLGPVRTIVSAKKQGEKLVVLCSTCYYVLKRVNLLIEADESKRKTVFDFLEEEYKGSLEVVHFLELVRDEIGFDKLKEKVTLNLKNISVAAYYGCQLLRPSKDVGIDDPFSPTIFERFLISLGCKSIDYPFKTECCGSFLVTSETQAVQDCVSKIIRYAVKNGADTITTSCPLCNFNLDWSQLALAKEDKKFKKIPIFYLTELMALALGIDIPNEVWDEHVIDPRAFLETKGYILATKK